MENLVAGDLSIDVEAGDQAVIRLIWRGKSNARNPSQILQPFFAPVLADAAEKKRAVELQFQKLEHFNSSTITSIIQVIQECRAKGIKLVIVFDQAVKWQKLSFDALRVFAKPDGLLELRPVPLRLPMEKALQLELRIPPQWARIDRVRQAVSLCIAAVFADTDLEDALAMTSAELLENAMKYGKSDSDRVTLTVFDHADEVVVSVSNALGGEGDAEALRRRIAWISGFESASDAYMAALAEVSERDGGQGGLGLVRIAYEGGCRLSCDGTGTELTVRAHHRFSNSRALARRTDARARATSAVRGARRRHRGRGGEGASTSRTSRKPTRADFSLVG